MLEFSLLGIFEAKHNGLSIEGLQNRRANQLLALLIVERNRRIQRHWIELVLDMTYEGLRKTEGVLRKCLGDEKARIKVENNSLFMDTHGINVDVFEFENLIARGNSDSLQAAIRLYRGGLLKDWDYTWLVEKREEIQESYLGAVQTVIKSTMRAQEYDKAVTFIRRFIQVYPQVDWAWSQLIEAYQLAGSVIEAEHAYRTYLHMLETRGAANGRIISPSKWVIEALGSPRDAPAVARELASRPADASSEMARFEAVGGAVPLNSPYYISRPTDEAAMTALQPQTSFVLIKGARQVGKTSLLVRLLQQGRDNNARVLFTHWQNTPQTELVSAESFLLSVAETIVDQLHLDINPREHFDSSRPATKNFERFLLRFVFPAIHGWIIWGIDEADTLFESSFRDDIFAMMRSWHNERYLDPGSDWERLTVVLSYATEAYLIQNVDQSPFNVGLTVELSDFTLEQVEELNQRCGQPFPNSKDLARLYALVGGHPYLVRRSLQEMMLNPGDPSQVDSFGPTDSRYFRDHLERMRLALLRDKDLAESVKIWLRNGTPPSEEHFARLCAAGVTVGSEPALIKARCRLYEQFLRRALL